MRDFLQRMLEDFCELRDVDYAPEHTTLNYQESVNGDALSGAWLTNRTSFIYKVGVLTVIGPKCDWVEVVIGVQRSDIGDPQLVGLLSFPEGENMDIRRVLDRAILLLELVHPVFEKQ